ncbi:hypothetical protein M011DRAFT_280367 [Sporormia fimetaria CBS 119925]|uniref:Heterokaryon incompatibility domain-containing protein n=1 Tax=Sporormia fimetaria CBS 119925 TaxID=1340428 RepID=A0A6A6VH06_9PLEO|nr:hypothetical protein M011DRAFT_280367 [Sporormia fimetaria CBS 119925]
MRSCAFLLWRDIAPLYLRVKQIRLLKITSSPAWPGSTDGDLRARIQTHDLSTAPPYTALSYRWSEWRDDNPEITLNGTYRTRIMQNLYNYLLTVPVGHYGPNPESEWLWIDSLCINQGSDERALHERSRQILTMGDIYAGAERVVAWLGLPSDEFNPLEYLQVWQKWFEKEGMDWSPRYLEQICDNEYWERAWVVQEIVQARDLEIRLGNHVMSSDTFRAFLDEHGILENSTSRLLEAGATQRTLPEWLEEYGQWKVSWPHDKVYAFLGLVHQPSPLHLTIDYGVHPDILHHELLQLDYERTDKIFRFSEYLHNYLKDLANFQHLGGVPLRRPNFSEEQESFESDVTAHLVGSVDIVTVMTEDVSRDCAAYSKAVEGCGRHGDVQEKKNELAAFSSALSRIDHSFFLRREAPPSFYIWPEDTRLRDEITQKWNMYRYRAVTRPTEAVLRSKSAGHWPSGERDPGRGPGGPGDSGGSGGSRTRPVANIIEVPVRDTVVGFEEIREYPNSPRTSRRWFSLAHPRFSNTGVCLCTGFTYGDIRKHDLVFQFPDTDIVLICCPDKREGVNEELGEWIPLCVKARAVLARNCCQRPEKTSTWRQVGEQPLRFRGLEEGDVDAYPRGIIRMRTLDLMKMSVPLRGVDEV